MLKRTSFAIFIVVILLIRFWGITQMPPHLRNDEASLGYNAYSILLTGKDEYGYFLPVFLHSFGDWKPALYSYLIIPFIALLGLNELSVRLPTLILSIVAIYLFYHLVLLLFNNKRIAYSAVFLLSTTPWHISLSRSAWEAGATITLTIAGVIFFLKGLSFFKLLPFSTLFLGSTFLMSHSAKPATLILLIVILIVYIKELQKIPKKILLLSSVILIILSYPVLGTFFNGQNTRVESLLIFNYFKGQNLSLIANNLLQSWANHYSFNVLFLNGDGNPQHSAADFAPFFLLDLLFMLLGIKVFISEKYHKTNTGKFILFWLILSPLSSVLAEGSVNIIRYLNSFIVLTLLMSLGLAKIRNFQLIIVSILYLLSFIIFLDAYFIHTAPKNGAWQYGYKDIVQFITPIQYKYEKIYIPQSPNQPYIFFLFYQQYPPQKIQKEIFKVFLPNQYNGMGSVSKLDNIEFLDLKKVNEIKHKNALIILEEHDALNKERFSNLHVIKQIKDPIGLPIYSILEYINE